MSKKKNEKQYNWLPDFVYGGIDGAITTFAVVAGVAGANLSMPVILILGFANLIADAFSMAIGKYSSDQAELERIQHITKMEERSIKENPKEEKEEIRDILKTFGFKGRDLARAESIITSDKEAWIHMMLHHEFHVVEENIQPKKGAAVTFGAFMLIGFIPLAVYTFQALVSGTEASNPEALFATTTVGTLLGLFIVGTVKSKFSEKHWCVSGIETAAIGGIAAGIAYLIGFLLGELLGVR